jgi:hypothetical protein
VAEVLSITILVTEHRFHSHITCFWCSHFTQFLLYEIRKHNS